MLKKVANYKYVQHLFINTRPEYSILHFIVLISKLLIFVAMHKIHKTILGKKASENIILKIIYHPSKLERFYILHFYFLQA